MGGGLPIIKMWNGTGKTIIEIATVLGEA